jgi:type I site-specific restriction-modification system R (restriction) subunit
MTRGTSDGLRLISRASSPTRTIHDGWKRLRTLLKELSAAFALAVPRPETETITPHLAFFQRVVAMIRKRLADDTGSGAGHARQRDIDAAVRQVIGGTVDADEVIDLFAVAGLEEARLDILSDGFLDRVAALEQKNLALETLRKLLNDQIRVTERTNIVQSRKFREALEDAMLCYTNKAITRQAIQLNDGHHVEPPWRRDQPSTAPGGTRSGRARGPRAAPVRLPNPAALDRGGGRSPGVDRAGAGPGV